MNAASPKSISRIGVPVALFLVVALFIGISVLRGQDNDINVAPNPPEPTDIVAPKAALPVGSRLDKDTNLQRRRLKDMLVRHDRTQKNEASIPSQENSSGADTDGVSKTDIAFMERLRDMWPVEPNVALRLADDGEERFKGTPYAAECAWIAVRALVEMGDFKAATEKSVEMVETYRGTHWAMDVQRHMLSHPPGE